VIQAVADITDSNAGLLLTPGERGELTLEEWVPTKARIVALVDEDQWDALRAIFPDGNAKTLLKFKGDRRTVRGHGRPHTVTRKVRLTWTNEDGKDALYGKMVRDLMADQLRWIEDRARTRRIDTGHAVASVEIAERATKLARGSG